MTMRDGATSFFFFPRPALVAEAPLAKDGMRGEGRGIALGVSVRRDNLAMVFGVGAAAAEVGRRILVKRMTDRCHRRATNGARN